MTFRPLSPPSRATDPQGLGSDAEVPASHRLPDLPAHAAMDPPRHAAVYAAAPRDAHRPARGASEGAGPAGRARFRPGVRPAGGAGTSPGTAASRARHGRRRRPTRGTDTGTAAASRLRADALLGAGPPVVAATTAAAGTTTASRGTAGAAGGATMQGWGRMRRLPGCPRPRRPVTRPDASARRRPGPRFRHPTQHPTPAPRRRPRRTDRNCHCGTRRPTRRARGPGGGEKRAPRCATGYLCGCSCGAASSRALLPRWPSSWSEPPYSRRHISGRPVRRR